ncbi:MAG TPA: hypothetical protein VHK69_15800, partial [Chitinophagaceae bacterium]|nr:hypothetical protein [Chitinophagaceae bacterium]
MNSRIPSLQGTALSLFTLAVTVMACKKGDQSLPGPQPPPPPGQEQFFKIKVRAMVEVGGVVYDSIAAPFVIVSWDKEGVVHQKDTLLAAGVNELLLPKSHTRYRIRFNKWNVSKDTTVLRPDLKEEVVYVIRAQKAP